VIGSDFSIEQISLFISADSQTRGDKQAEFQEDDKEKVKFTEISF